MMAKRLTEAELIEREDERERARQAKEEAVVVANIRKGTVKTLERIDRLLVEKGWVQEEYHTPGRGYCLIGAIEKVDGEYELEARASVVKAIGTMFVERWNDKKGRKKSEVRAALKKAIKHAETVKDVYSLRT
jgi:hypothetical protein